MPRNLPSQCAPETIAENITERTGSKTSHYFWINKKGGGTIFLQYLGIFAAFCQPFINLPFVLRVTRTEITEKCPRSLPHPSGGTRGVLGAQPAPWHWGAFPTPPSLFFQSASSKSQGGGVDREEDLYVQPTTSTLFSVILTDVSLPLYAGSASSPTKEWVGVKGQEDF